MVGRQCVNFGGIWEFEKFGLYCGNGGVLYRRLLSVGSLTGAVKFD